MNGFLQKAKDNKFLKILKNLLSSKFFPLFLIPISLLCYYLGLDMVMMYVIGILGALIVILLDDISPVVSVLLFMTILVSGKNSTLVLSHTTDFYFQTANLIQIFILIAIFASSAIYRVVLNIVRKQFKLSSVFFSLCALAVVLMLNGVASKDYNAKNLLFGLIMALCFCGVFSALKDNIFTSTESFIKIAYGFFAFGITLLIELVIKYATVENLVVNGIINRELLTFGWGIWNTMGMYLALCIPFVVYLAGKEKFGYFYAGFSVFIFVATVMTCSRQSIGGALIVYPVSLLLLFIKGKNKLQNAAAMLIGVGILVVFVLFYNDSLFKYFTDLFKKIIVNGEFSGNGRKRIWQEALAHFKSSPIFGAGFYIDTSAAHYSGLSFMPTMMHNTIMEILSACGILGLIAYSAHRVTTVISYFKNITVERTYLMLAIVVLLFISLVDNHIFNIFPTIIYSCLIAMLTSSEKKVENI